MDAISLLRMQLQLAHWVLESTMADVTEEQAHWSPPGLATPLGASYAHTVFSEDLIVGGVLAQQAPLLAGEYAGKTGTNEPMPMPGPEWANYGDWTRRVRLDLPAMRQYAQEVYRRSDEYLASLTPDDLDRTLDLTGIGMGEQTLGWALSLLVVGHINNLAGEISCLKGLQGAKGYPF